MRICRTAMACLTLLMAPVGSAHAQDFSVDFWSWTTIIPSVAQTDILGTHLRQLRQEQEERDAASLRTTKAPSAKADLALLRYTPSKERRRANAASFVSKTRANDPAGARSLEELFARGDIIAQIAPAIGSYDLRVDDVADAYSVWWISAWQAAHGRSETFDKATYQAVRDQVARALSAAPEMNTADDGAKQQLAEALLIQATLLDGAAEQAKGDPTKLRLLAKAAVQGGRGMGLDLMTMNLTPAGFVASD